MPDPATGTESAQARAASIRYIETSALLSALLEQEPAAKRELRAAGHRVTSALTVAESYRAIVRARASGRLDAAQERAVVRALQTFLARCDLVAVTDDVLARAGRPFPAEPIRTLAAIHLATADILGDPPPLVTIVTRDARVRENARAMGFATG
ncbi:MAG TPA: type II toxin-antitoxin system VapC family toxin [Gemmatimonadaceae bacterium]